MAAKNFTHLVITRFNVDFDDLNKTKYGADVRSLDWLTHRFEIFEKYCFPSVQNQSEQDFKWLVFFDAATPEAFKNKIERYHQMFTNFLPVYIPSGQLFLAEIQNGIRQLVTTPFVITSRLDNDDMLHEDFVKTIQRNFHSQPDCIIDAPYGMQLNIEHNKTRLITSYNLYGPFISLVEQADLPRSVYFKQHKHWRGHKNVIRITNRLWTQIIHSNNVLNRFHENRNYCLHLAKLDAFGVNIRTINSFGSEHAIKILAHNVLVPFYRLLFMGGKGAGKIYSMMRPVNKNHLSAKP